MAENATETTTPPAGLDPKALAETVSAAIGAALKPLEGALAKITESVAALSAKPAESKADPKAGAGGDAAAPLTAEAVQKLLADALAENAKTAESTAKITAAVKAAADKHLAGVPGVYHTLLPQTDDAAALEARAKEIREQFQKDLAASGVRAVNVGATPGANATPAGGAIDASKINLVKAIASGYGEQKK